MTTTTNNDRFGWDNADEEAWAEGRKGGTAPKVKITSTTTVTGGSVFAPDEEPF